MKANLNLLCRLVSCMNKDIYVLASIMIYSHSYPIISASTDKISFVQFNWCPSIFVFCRLKLDQWAYTFKPSLEFALKTLCSKSSIDIKQNCTCSAEDLLPGNWPHYQEEIKAVSWFPKCETSNPLIHLKNAWF